MMESEVTGNCHASFGERDKETRKLQDLKVRSVPTLLSPLLANIALNGIESIHRYHRNSLKRITKNTSEKDIIHPSVRYADDVRHLTRC
jgi:retron-type reverse transcriptase